MSTKKATKRALLTSILAICLCLVMLIGSTFAWFTDTASTGVNKIQSGTLDVDIVDANGNSLNGKMLQWVDKDGNALDSKNILWEPNCTYNLQPFTVINKGNLALQYEITITGIQGDAELNEVIEWTINGADLTNAQVLLPAGTKEGDIDKDRQVVTISGHMLETAGNKYQGLSIDGIAITVTATQTPYEHDSISDQYDANADYTPDNLDQMVTANVTKTMPESGDLTLQNENKTVTAVVPADAADAGTDVTLTVVPAEKPAGVTVAAGQASKAYDVNVTGLKVGNTAKVTVTLFVGKGLTGVKVFHNSDEITDATYDSATGIVTFETASFSPFTVVYDAPAVATIGDTQYDTLADAFAAAKDGDTIVLMSNSNGNGVVVEPGKFTTGLTVDFNGHTYTVGGVLVGSAGTGTNAFQLKKNNKITFKNGSIVGATEGTTPAEDTPDWHGAPAIVIQNYCDLTLDNMTVSGGDETVYTMSNNCGDIIINSTTINAGKAIGYVDGPFAFDVDGGWGGYTYANVTVSGNSVINGVFKVTTGATLTITGGTFSTNPSAYLAEGCTATESNGYWTVK